MSDAPGHEPDRESAGSEATLDLWFSPVSTAHSHNHDLLHQAQGPPLASIPSSTGARLVQPVEPTPLVLLCQPLVVDEQELIGRRRHQSEAILPLPPLEGPVLFTGRTGSQVCGRRG